MNQNGANLDYLNYLTCQEINQMVRQSEKSQQALYRNIPMKKSSPPVIWGKVTGSILLLATLLVKLNHLGKWMITKG